MNTAKVEITLPCLVLGRHCDAGVIVDVPNDVAFNLIAANRGKRVTENRIKVESESPVETQIQVKESALPPKRRR